MKEKSHCTRYRIKRDAPTKLDIVASEVLTSELYQAEFWVTYDVDSVDSRNRIETMDTSDSSVIENNIFKLCMMFSLRELLLN